MFSKVSVRLGFVFGLLVFLAAALGYFTRIRSINQQLLANLRAEMRRELSMGRAELEAMPSVWADSSLSQSWAKRTGVILGVRVTLVDSSGRVTGDSFLRHTELLRTENHRGRPEIRAALRSGFGERMRSSATIRQEMLYMAVSLGGAKPYGVLRFAKPVPDIVMLESQVRRDIEAGLFLALGVSLLAGVLGAIVLSRPLERLARTAERRAHGDFSGTLPLHRNDEIGQLARGIGFLSEEVQGIRRQEEWYRAVFSGIREAIVVTDACGEIVLVNPVAARLFRLENAMQLSRPVQMPPDSQLRENIAGVYGNGSSLLKEEVTLATARGERVMQISSMPVKQGSRSEGTVFVFNDITRLRNLERVRRDFVSGVSHELRTPLASIKGYAETLLEGAMHDSRHAATFLQIILKESEQLTALVNDVLDLASLESGKIPYSFGPVDLCGLIDKNLELLMPAINRKQIRIERNYRKDSVPSPSGHCRAQPARKRGQVC